MPEPCPSRRPRRRLPTTAAALGVPLVLALAAPAPTASAAADTVRLSFSQNSSSVSHVGSADVTVDIVTLDGGSARGVPGRTTTALDFPDYDGSGSYPRAVVRVRNDGSGDPLSPGWSDFEFGADFRLDRRSSGRSVDNGDNLIQRGLWGSSGQYKAEVDDGRPTCVVRGDDGRVTVRAPHDVEREEWYRLRCLREGNAVTLQLTHYGSNGTATTTRTATGAIGTVSLSRSIPLAVGGKLTESGSVAGWSTDQFNGLVENPMLRVG